VEGWRAPRKTLLARQVEILTTPSAEGRQIDRVMWGEGVRKQRCSEGASRMEDQSPGPDDERPKANLRCGPAWPDKEEGRRKLHTSAGDERKIPPV